ncbi:ATP-binding cassette domain-containing protein [Microbacterium amylolyticum]|uniref:Multiple sugar transport system ATP-binding protein n=1 Tax=Microbacterium amylolyticum TaxID=936337 RepID=A0ABS4ZGS2_9MICO|nr:ATP-binding cassette domain-containing protein [Microbacterium amylolyticum]MBP2436480.1 putative multiple sugar transport system ATP-binding protein [Microbacterium amylolyticum]
MSDHILSAVDITMRFPGVAALSNVSLDVRAGEVHAICGENGAGKSTLMNVLSGVHPAGSFDGTIRFDGRDVLFRSLRESEAEGIVVIHQELALVPQLSIAENIHLGNEITRGGLIDWEQTALRAAELLARVGLDENPLTPVGELGIGGQQLIAIARALAKNVRLLILDEPTAALTDSDSERLLAIIEQLRSQGITCIVISHKLREVLRIADTITVLRDGTTIETMRADNPETDENHIIRAMVGRDLDSLFPPREPDIGEEVFRVENWTVHHSADRRRTVVDDVSLSVRAGEIIGLAGLMGSGRTALAMSIFGRSAGSAISGTAYKRGERIDLRSVSQAIEHGIAYATEDRRQFGLNLIGDIQANVSAAAITRLSHAGIVDHFREHKVADAYRYKLNIKTPNVAAITGDLSGGNQQKVVLSKWMFTNPDVLILDEPTRGIDVGAKYEIYGIINELAAQGRAIIVISSELPEVIGLSDRIYAFRGGRITAEVDRADATQDLLMRYLTAES